MGEDHESSDTDHGDGVIPPDTWAARIAIVRSYVGWTNFDVAERATGIASENFRRWEHHVRRCKDPVRVAHILAAASRKAGKPVSWRWIAYGGPMPGDPSAVPPAEDEMDCLPVDVEPTYRIRRPSAAA